MYRTNTLLLLCAALLWLSHMAHADVAAPTSASGYATPVSIFELRANPERYSNTLVEVEGILSYAYEDIRVYFSQEDYIYGRMSNSIGIAPFRSNSKDEIRRVDQEFRGLHGNSVVVKGWFRYKPKYPVEAFSLVNIERVEEKPPMKRTPR